LPNNIKSLLNQNLDISSNQNIQNVDISSNINLNESPNQNIQNSVLNETESFDYDINEQTKILFI
jgi:hypothetical protein